MLVQREFSMWAQKTILVLGADAMLLDTRRRVLEHAGLTVTSALSVPEAEVLLRENEIALLLLCHTLSAVQCERANAVAHLINPKIVTLALASPANRCVEASDVVIHQMSGPPKLVETVQGLLQ
jgi:DNA-binding response OmpR family regulator